MTHSPALNTSLSTTVPEPPDALTRPSRWQSFGEFRAARETLRIALRTPALSRSPRGNRSPLIIVPGYGAGDSSMAPLRSFLARMDHDVRPSGMGRINDDVDAQRIRFGEIVAEVHRTTGQRVNLVGWSLGGVLCREVARDLPHAVDRIVTFGTPVEGGPTYTSLGQRYPDDLLQLIRDYIEVRYRTPLTTPVTAIWSRRDGIVSPDACIDRRSPDVEHVEVTSTHLGMGLDPDVWAVIADRLSALARHGCVPLDVAS